MNAAPDNAALIDRLAAEYVLGTLRGAARRRLERWRTSSGFVEQRCTFWEERLLPLLHELRPLQPPPHVWRAIQARLELPASVPRGALWRPLALAASVLLVTALAALLYWRTLAPGRAVELATISAPSGALMWQVEVSARAGEAHALEVRAGAFATHPPGRDYELWALPASGQPVSLGVLPYHAAALHRALSRAQTQALAGSLKLAVSVEPPGGSPTGQPTGAIVFVVPLQTVG
jgi:anti-sigma-K factor RskA